MTEETYSDGVSEITVTGSIVRIDLMSLSPAERDRANNPQPVVRRRIIMPADAFAGAADLMQKVVRSLIESGAIQYRKASPQIKKCDNVKNIILIPDKSGKLIHF